GPGMRHEDRVRNIEPQYQGMESELRAPRWLRALNFLLRIVFFPVRRPIRFLMIALVAFMLFNTLRGFGVGRLISGYVADVSSARQRADTAMSSVSSFVEKRIMRPSHDARAPPAPPPPRPPPPPATPPTAISRARPPPATSPPQRACRTRNSALSSSRHQERPRCEVGGERSLSRSTTARFR